MPVKTITPQIIQDVPISKAITTEEIIQDVQNWYQVNINCVLRLLAKAKYGRGSERELTKTEKEIFCLACSIYSDLEKSFIREYRRRISRDELNVYIEILNDSNINLKKRKLATQYRNKLRREIAKTSCEISQKKLNTKLRIATISVKVFDDRVSWSRLKNLLVNPILNLDSDSLLTPPMIMTLFSYRYPLILNEPSNDRRIRIYSHSKSQ